jgi:uncharacterized membrane protein (DUF4010 family)
MQEYYESLPQNLIDFFLVTVFSFLIGLSQRRLNLQSGNDFYFGSDRTFTLIGILGFILYILEPRGMMLYAGGGIILGLILTTNYFFKIQQFQRYGITAILTAFLTYCMAPLVITQPMWLTLLVVVVILLITEMKETFISLAKRLNNDEFITLAKFILIIGIVLPMLPDTPIIEDLSLTPYRIWLATVVISTISYVSYLLNKFVFPKSGIILSGILGGLYSSTATVIILAKKCKSAPEKDIRQYAVAAMAAISTMYVRVWVLLSIFNQELFAKLTIYFVIMTVVCAVISVFLFLFKRNKTEPVLHEEVAEKVDNNPLEFKVALLFAILFVIFTVVTKYTIEYFGTQGLNVLSIIIGVTDITPFLLTLFEGGYPVSNSAIGMATFYAIISSNISKVLFGIAFSGNRKPFTGLLLGGLGLIVVFNIVLLFFM